MSLPLSSGLSYTVESGLSKQLADSGGLSAAQPPLGYEL